MGQVGIFAVHITGDIGGAGISRFHFNRTDSGTITSADCGSTGNALHAFYNSVALYMPADITVSFDPVCKVIDADSGALVANLNSSTSPANVIGAITGSYPAGVGARLNWKTTTVHNRRFVRSATAIVPLHASAFTNNGSVGAAAQPAIQAAAVALLVAMTTAALDLVAYHRPALHATSGGLAASIVGSSVGTTPMGLRSRRS
jgi:hypothetical protein